MNFTKAPGFGERFSFPENVKITINGDTLSTIREAAVRMAERWEESVVCEIVKEARMAGYTEVTVLNKEVILEALRRYVMPPKTNADRIRALSDEHLANYLYQFTDIDCRIGFCQNLPKCEELLDTEDGISTDSMCKKCLLDWLRKPAEDL
jgi:hypothetical protein